MKIGAIIESFKLKFWDSVALAKSIGATGIQSYTSGETVNTELTKKQIQEINRRMKDEGMEFSAICGDLGCRMFYLPDENRHLIEKEKRIMELALELGTNIVTTHIGVVPEDKTMPQYRSMHKVAKELADFADSCGGRFAVETGPESAILLKDFLDGLDSRGVSVNLDPANLIMCAGDDPVKAVYTLKDYIVHTHAKDGIQLAPVDTRKVYAAAYFGVEAGDYSKFREVPLGQGSVDWDAYIDALKSIGFDGYLTIEREVGDKPAEDIAAAANFLKKYTKSFK